MRNKHLKTIAAFLIALIVSLPIYSSFVFASLSNPSIKGSNEVEGYIRDHDSVTIQVDAYTDGSSIDLSQLRLYDQSGPEFNLGCNPKAKGHFDCSIIIEAAKLHPSPINVLLYYDSQTDSISIPYYKDISPPTIASFTSNPSIIGSGNIKFSYKIEDRAGKTPGKCAGIKELVLTSGAYSRVIPINTQADNCVYEDTLSEDINEITKIDHGNITIEAKAYDNFGQESSPAKVIITVDRLGPLIDINSFKILDSNNNELHHFSGKMTVSAIVDVTDSDIASVKADFTSLWPGNSIKAASCTNGACKWSNVIVDLATGGDKEIIINATDSLGNIKSETIIYSLEFDNTKPIIIDLKTNHVDSQGNSYLGNGNNTIILEINEAGIGFNNKNVYLDLRNINNNQNAKADNCIKNDTWNCYWYNVKVTASDGSKQISIKPNSVDDLNNPISGTLTYNLIVDKTNPVISGISYTPQAPTSADTITFNIKVKDNSNEADIIINSSAISTTPLHTDSCIGSSGNIDCSVLVDDIVSSHTSANILVIVEDAAGNKVTQQKEVTIYQSDPSATPTFYRVSNIELIPSRVDRKVASQLPLNIFVHINLQGAGSGRIIGKTVDCMEMAGYLSESPYLMNEYEDDPYIVLKTNQALGTFEENFPIRCKLRLNVRDEQNIYTNFEEENINAELELYGNVLGNMEENIAEKLDAISSEIADVDDKIDDYEKWLKIFGTYCTIAQMIGQLNQAFQALKAAIWGVVTPIWTVCATCCATLNLACCACMVAAHASWTAACTGHNLFHHLVDSFFWPIGTWLRVPTDPWTIAGWFLKIACMIFWNCALSDWDGVLGLAGEAISMFAASKVQNDPQKKYKNDDKVIVKQGGEDVTYTRSTTTVDGKSKVEWKTEHYKFKDNVYDDASIDIFMNIKGTRSNLVNRPQIIYTRYDSRGDPIVRQGDDIFVVNRETGDTIKVIEIENLPPVDDSTYRTILNEKLSTFDIAPDGQFRERTLFSTTTYKNIGKIDASGNPIVQDNNHNYYWTKYGQIRSRIAIASGADDIVRLNYLPDAPEGRYQFGTDFIPTEESKSLLSKGIDISKTGMEASGNNPYLWSQAGQKTELGGIFGANYVFNPYKSIHYAEISMCLPAIVYNLKKDKQIKCMYRNCLQNHIMSGQTTTVCDFAYKERECLYVESAQFLKHGYGGWMDNLMNALLKYAVFLILGWVITKGPCKPYFSPGTAALCADIPPGAMSITSVTCGLLGATIMFMEFNAIFNSRFGFNGDDKMELKGKDYCAGGDDGL